MKMNSTVINLVYPKPNIVLSKCLGVSACRYNGQIILDKIVDELAAHMNFIAVCPEEEIGLGIPRDPIRLEENNNQIALVQPKTGRNITEEMVAYSKQKTKDFNNIDGFILKDRSPSCGTNNVKIYSKQHSMVVKKSAGLFAEMMKEAYPDLPMENEGRLSNKYLREHFLTAIYTLARFREIYANKNITALQQFHAQHKYLLMVYNQTLMKELGKIAANTKKLDIGQVHLEYYNSLIKIFRRYPRKNSQINIFLHNFGYFKDLLESKEKVMFLELLEKFRNGILTGSTINHLIMAWVIKYDVNYLANQYWFAPFPEELLSLPNSGRNRQVN